MNELTNPSATNQDAGSWRSMTLDRLMGNLLALLFGLTCTISLVAAWVIFSGSLTALKGIPFSQFFTDQEWHPTESLYGLKPMLIGSMLSSCGAVAVAVPVSLAIAAALNFYVPRIWAFLIRRLLFVMASIPTVIFGFWGLTEVVPLIAQVSPPGVSLLSGILILSLMILPTTALLIDAAFLRIPKPLIHSAYALGASTNQICLGMALPVAKGGVFSAALLSLGRALGETIIVVMVTGNKAKIPAGLFDPIRTLTANVALEIGYADPLHGSVLFLSILILLIVATTVALLVYVMDASSRSGLDV